MSGSGEKKAKRRSRWRHPLWLVTGLVGLVLLAVVILLATLRWAGPRQALLERVVPEIERRTGLDVEVGDFRLRVWSTSLELAEVAVAHPGSPPFLRGDRARIALALRPLLGGRLEIRALEGDGLELDLERLDIERFSTGGGAGGADPLRVRALDLELAGVRGLPLPEALEPWLVDWRIEGGRIGGELGADGVDLTADGVGIVLERRDAAVEVGKLSGRLRRSAEGELELPELILAGRGVDVRVFGAGEPGGSHHWQGDFDVDPAALFALPRGAGGRMRGRGELSLPGPMARLELDLEGVPVEVAAPWLEEDLLELGGAAGSRVDLAGQVRYDHAADATQLTGKAELLWRRGAAELLQARAVTPAEVGGGESRARLEAVLRPGLPGTRELAADLVLDPGAGPGDLRIEDGELRLEVPDLRVLWADLVRHWPALLPVEPPDQLQGSLAANGAFAGPVGDLQGAGALAWRPDEFGAVRLTFDGSTGEPRFSGELELSGLDPALLGAPFGGRVGGQGDWRASPVGISVAADLVTHLETSAEGLDAAGRLAVDLAEGLLLLDASALEVADVRGRLGARVPLASLGALVSDGPATGPSPEPLQLEWDIDDGSTWHGLVSALTGEPAAFELAAGSSGELALDPGRPTASAGRMTLGSAVARFGEVLGEGPDEIELRAEAGYLELAPAELAVGRETLVVGGRVGLDPAWRPGTPSAAAIADLDLRLAGSIPVSSLVPGLDPADRGGALDLDLSVAGALPVPDLDLEIGSSDAFVILGGERSVRLAEPELTLTVRPEGMSELHASWSVGEGRARFTGSLPAEDPWRQATATLELDRPLPEIDRLRLPLWVESGSLVSRGAILDGAGVESRFDLTVPLATLSRLVGEGDAGFPLPRDAADGPFALSWRAPHSEWSRLLAALGIEEPPILEAGLSLELELDPGRLTQGRGEVELDGLAMVIEGRKLVSEGPLRLSLADGVLEVEPGRLLVDGVGLELSGTMELAEGWAPGDPPASLFEHLEGRVAGQLPAKLLNPLLAGGRAEGLLEVRLDVGGAPESLAGELVVRGPDATLAFLSPYVTRIRDLELDVQISNGEAEIRQAELELNEGRVELTGRAGLERGIDLAAVFEGVRYRLDYGLITELSGNLALAARPGAEKARLTGRVSVDRGWLNRSIRIHRDLLAEILSPTELIGTEDSVLDHLELDLQLIQREGVRVDNNLADLWVRWEPLAITGTAAAPAIDGRLDADPGGLVFLFGQTVRLDRAVLTYPGQPGAAPTLDLETTTSLEDPSIGRLEGLDPMTAASATPTTAQAKGAALAAGLAGYYGEEIAARIARSFGASRFSIRPVLVFGEVDPSARLNLGTDVSPSVSLAASVDLRSAERQTYLLDVHEIPGLPSFRGQVFTTDRGSEGATAQQHLAFGGTPVDRVDGPRIRSIEVQSLTGASGRSIRRASGLTKGQRLPDWGTFAAEVEIEAFLRDAGYPDARVAVEAVPSAEDRVDLVVDIAPGPRVDFAFTGVKLPRSLRESVSELYRADFFEEASLLEMERQAVLALRSQGYMEPSARIGVAPSPETGKGYERRVTVATAAGRRTSLEDLILVGLPDAAAAQAVERFPTRLQRVELAEGVPAADRRLERTLAGLGWPEARVESRAVSEDGDTLTVMLDPGVRLRLGEIRLETAAGEPWPADAPDLAPEGLRSGDPLSSDLLARAALGLERDLTDLGYDQARVAAGLVPRAGTDAEVDVVFTVDPGERRQFGETRFAGLRSAREPWAEARADLATGGPARQEEILAARRRLYESGRFSSVVSNLEPATDDRVDVVFDVRERPRFRLAYGLRWDSDEGGSAVVDLVDESFLRRGVTLGGRALYSANDKSLRLNASWPFLLFNKGTLEVFALGRRELDDGLFFDTLESTLQLGYPLGESNTVRFYTRYRDVHIYEEEPDPFFPIDIRVRNPFVGFQLIHDRRDAPEMTNRGLFASADLSLSDDFLASDLSYARFFGQVNLFRPAGWALGRRLTWAQSYRVGFARAFKGQELRLEDRLYAGGEYSVRGYPRESLGPPGKDSPFLKVSEDALFVMNQELRFDVLESLAALLFVDMGNTWTGTTGYDLDLFKSAGFGLRARTPVGLVRLDLAFPLDRRETDAAYKVYLGFGNVF